MTLTNQVRSKLTYHLQEIVVHAGNTGELHPEHRRAIEDLFATTLETEVQKAVKAERKSWYSPFDGLEIKLMYRAGDKVVQNRYIFSLEQMNFIKGISEVVQLKFSYMLKDLLANSLSHNKEEGQV